MPKKEQHLHKIDDMESLSFPDYFHQLTYIIVTNNNDVISLEEYLDFWYVCRNIINVVSKYFILLKISKGHNEIKF